MAESAGYSGTPLARKLGIRPEARVLLIGTSPGFDLGPLPAGVAVHRRRSPGTYDVVLALCADRAALARRFEPAMSLLRPASALWIGWPKKASGVPTDLDDNVVRRHGLDLGMVDVKVCAIDQVWSGLKFVYRLADRPSLSRIQA